MPVLVRRMTVLEYDVPVDTVREPLVAGGWKGYVILVEIFDLEDLEVLVNQGARRRFARWRGWFREPAEEGARHHAVGCFLKGGGLRVAAGCGYSRDLC